MSTIEIDNLQMKFGEFVALKDISLKVTEGEFLTLLGPSGCGKSTLLKLISGFLAPTKGAISIGGKDVRNIPPEARDTAMCFQSYALFPHLSVKENLLFGMKQKRLSKQEQQNRLQPVIEQLGLEAQLSKLPNQLSGGQQQRVALGRALVMQPGVVLFDEPLSNLDAKLRETVRMEIRKIQQDNNLTAIYVTHDQAEALAMSDRILVMNNGKIEQVGSPKEIYHKPKTSFVADFIGRANVMKAQVISSSKKNSYNLSTPLGELVVHSLNAPAAKDLYVCWRPEKIKFEPQGVNQVTANISAKSFQGNFTDLFFEFNGTYFRLQAPETVEKKLDGHVQFSIQPDDLILLEPIQ